MMLVSKWKFIEISMDLMGKGDEKASIMTLLKDTCS
ncbi:MAG: hypothetical protein ACI9FE_000741 [Porticoccaceae bacterium]|jgi:hypothetical protein